MATTFEEEVREQAWRYCLQRYLLFQGHTGRHMWRWIMDPLDQTKRVRGCWKCGKLISNTPAVAKP